MKNTILLATALLFLCTTQTYSQASESKVMDLLESTGMAEMAKQSMVQMINMQKQSNPEVPEQFWIDFQKEANTEELMKLMIPIYRKYYTDEDITELIAFYKTPIGQKTLAVTPALMQETMQVGQQWGMQLGEKIAKKLNASGY